HGRRAHRVDAAAWARAARPGPRRRLGPLPGAAAGPAGPDGVRRIAVEVVPVPVVAAGGGAGGGGPPAPRLLPPAPLLPARGGGGGEGSGGAVGGGPRAGRAGGAGGWAGTGHADRPARRSRSRTTGR